MNKLTFDDALLQLDLDAANDQALIAADALQIPDEKPSNVALNSVEVGSVHHERLVSRGRGKARKEEKVWWTSGRRRRDVLARVGTTSFTPSRSRLPFLLWLLIVS